MERGELLALPVDALERVQHYTLSDSDLAIIRQRRGEENRLGFAVQVCYLRFPGGALGVDEIPEAVLMELLVKQLGIRTESWDKYDKRPQSRVEHVAELQTRLGLRTFALSDDRRWALTLAELAQRTDRGAASDSYPTLKPLIGASINTKIIHAHWDDILRLTTSIKIDTVTASLMLRKLGSYPRQNGLARALRELGRLERTLFTLDWIQNPKLRRRVQAGLTKGKARTALARAVFFNRLGELRDPFYDNQRYRASGLNLLTAAITLWNNPPPTQRRKTPSPAPTPKPSACYLFRFVSCPLLPAVSGEFRGRLWAASHALRHSTTTPVPGAAAAISWALLTG
ncbi:Tn3 family transposase [Cryobacterium sp. Hz9]|nr:Tn3 family transposase [Cryobacterium sp. Hz9]